MSAMTATPRMGRKRVLELVRKWNLPIAPIVEAVSFYFWMGTAS
jgi:hypothetical protein